MKILLISDIHLGVKNNSEIFLYNTRDFFLKQISQNIFNYDIQQLWILGDLFDSRITTNVLVNNIALQIMANLLTKHQNLQIKILCGNHDVYYKNTLSVSSLKIFLKFHKNLEIINEVKEYNLDGNTTLVVPWLIEGSKNWSDFSNCINNKTYDTCFGHFEINGFEVIKGITHKNGFEPNTFKDFKNVFSGHFHIRNKIRNIQYLGCPYEITWNDYGDPKGFTIFDTQSQTYEFIQNEISPKHKKIIYSSLEMDKSLLKEVPNNFIKLVIDKKITTQEDIDVQNSILELKPIDFKIEKQYDDEEELKNNDIDISEVSKDTLSIIKDYNDSNPLPSEINNDEFSFYMKKLHDMSLTDTD